MKIEKIFKKIRKAVKNGLIPFDTVNNAGGYSNGEYPGRVVKGFTVRRTYGSGVAFQDEEIEVYYRRECLLYHRFGWCDHADGYTEFYDEAPTSIRSVYARKIWNLFG